MNPCKVAIGASEVIELGLLADPEDAVGHDAHQEDEKARRESNQRAPEIAFGVNCFDGRNAEIEHEQRHGYGEDAITQSSEALDALAGNAIVERMHRMKSSGLAVGGQKLPG